MSWLRFFKRRSDAPVLHVADDVGSGPAVVMVHGLASSSVTFKALIPLLSRRHRCIAIDLLGFGESPAPPDATYTIEEHVAAIRATVASLRIREPFILIGHSMGALLAARFAAVHRSMVSRLILIGPPIFLPPQEIGNPRRRAIVGRYLKAYEFLRVNKEFTLANSAWVSKMLRLARAGLFEVTESSWDAFTLSMKNCIESQTSISDIAAVEVPIDVVYGRLDALIASGMLEIVAKMRHVTMHRVEVNDHLVRPRLARVVAGLIEAPSA